MKTTMTTNGEKGKSIKTNIAEVCASRVSCFPLDDIEFFEWTRTNKYGHLWYFLDISQLPIFQRAIKKAIKNVRIMTHKAHCLQWSQMNRNKDVVSLLDLLLHTKRAMCWCHSTFTVLFFYTEEVPSTIVTCLLTARNHILLKMQDQILQVVQLIQYRISQLFSIVITNNFFGEEVTLDENSVCGFKMMGFQTMSEDEESNVFILRLELPIPFPVLGDSYSWAKYGHHILPSIWSISSRKKFNSVILFGNAS
jgi:hypothetical protein